MTVDIERCTDNFYKIALDRDFKKAGLVGDLNDIETKNQIKIKNCIEELNNNRNQFIDLTKTAITEIKKKLTSTDTGVISYSDM